MTTPAEQRAKIREIAKQCVTKRFSPMPECCGSFEPDGDVTPGGCCGRYEPREKEEGEMAEDIESAIYSALAVIGEPTEGMIDAGKAIIRGQERFHFTEVYRAIIAQCKKDLENKG